jgi:glycerophosphoryl diester phosphodiesterase
MKKIFTLVVASVLVLVSPGAGAAAPIDVTDPVVVIAHKAGPFDAPENTHQAITVAKQKNSELTWAEIDVRWNKSNFPFLMHNPTVDATTNYSGNLRDYWFNDVMKMNAADYSPWNTKNTDGTWKYPQYHGTTTNADGVLVDNLHPSYVWEFLNAAKNANVNLLLDVKDIPNQIDADKLWNYLTRFDYTDKVIYMSSPAGVKAMKAMYPSLDYVVIEYPATDMTRTIESVKALGATGYAIPYPRVTKTLVDYYHSGGLKIFTWTSDTTAIDVQANWSKAVSYGVDALITNKHKEAQAILP